MNVKAYQQSGDQHGAQREQGDSHRAQQIHHAHGPTDVFQVTGSPELGEEHRRARVDAKQHQIEQKENLVCAAGRRHGVISQRSDHHHVDQVDRRSQEKLRGDGECRAKNHFDKRWFKCVAKSFHKWYLCGRGPAASHGLFLRQAPVG